MTDTPITASGPTPPPITTPFADTLDDVAKIGEPNDVPHLPPGIADEPTDDIGTLADVVLPDLGPIQGNFADWDPTPKDGDTEPLEPMADRTLDDPLDDPMEASQATFREAMAVAQTLNLPNARMVAETLELASDTIRLLHDEKAQVQRDLAAAEHDRDDYAASVRSLGDLLDTTMAAKVDLADQLAKAKRSLDLTEWTNRVLFDRIERDNRDFGLVAETLRKSSEAKTAKAAATMKVVRTLYQDRLGRPEARSDADQEWSKLLSEGWATLDVAYPEHPDVFVRFVTLVREVPAPAPQPEMYAAEGAYAERLAVNNWPVGDPALDHFAYDAQIVEPLITFHPPRTVGYPIPTPLNALTGLESS